MSYGFKSLVKLGVRQKIFKNTAGRGFFENRPPTWRLPGANLSQILRFWNFFTNFVGFVFKGISLIKLRPPHPQSLTPTQSPTPPTPHIPPILWDNNNLNTIWKNKYLMNQGCSSGFQFGVHQAFWFDQGVYPQLCPTDWCSFFVIFSTF